MRTLGWMVVALAGCGSEVCPGPSGPARIDFADTVIGERVLSVAQLRNTCGDELAVTDVRVDGDAGFEVDEAPGRLPSGETPIALAFTADDYGQRIAELTVESAEGTFTTVLTGNAAADQDGDGVDAFAAGGEDCDDTDPDVVEARPEEVNGRDDDCDGLVDEDFVTAGEVILTEVMIQPQAADPAVGQWVELRNETRRTLDLSGWTLSGPAGVLTIEPGVRISGGERVVVGLSADTAVNGGIEVDGVMTGDGAPLPTQGWHLALAVDSRTVAVLSDRRWPEEAGASIALDPIVNDPSEATSATAWCSSTAELASGDRGTPGEPNDLCPQFDHDGDGLSALDGDCDDTDRDISPLAVDVWDGVDNNCDGVVDLLIVPDAADGIVRGDRDRLGSFVRVGDWDDDGADEALIGAGLSGSTQAVHLAVGDLIGEGIVGVDDVTLGLFDQAGGFGAGGAITGVTAPFDADADGDDDIVLLGRPASFYREDTAYDYLWVHEGLPDDPATPVNRASALLTVTDPFDGVNAPGVQALIDVDLDGDGAVDTTFGHGSYKGDVDTNDRVNKGRVWVLDLAGQTGVVAPQDLARASWTGRTENTSLGDALDGGDVDDDGYDDIVTVDLDRTGVLESRRVQVIPGSADLPSDAVVEDVASLTITGLAPAEAAFDPTPAGPLLVDADEDGTLDLLVPDPAGGGVRLFRDVAALDGEVDASAADLVIGRGSRFGVSLVHGDVGGDGTLDLLIGEAPEGSSRQGRAWLFAGSALTGTEDVGVEASWAAFQARESSSFGSVPHIADVTGDGAAEVIIGDAGSYTFDGAVFTFVAPE